MVQPDRPQMTVRSRKDVICGVVWRMSVLLTAHGMATVICLSFHIVAGQNKDFQNHPVATPASPVRITQPVGSEVRLQCCNKGRRGILYQEHCSSHDVVWHYRRCGDRFNFTSCDSLSSNESWRTICGSSSNPCNSTVILNITTEGDSGLYRCSMSHRNRTSRNFKVTQIYELEVTERLGPPEILQEQPSNVTVHQGNRAIFQCRVHSKDRPIFYWLRRTDYRTSNYVSIPLLNDTYEASSEHGKQELPGDIYLSKLILSRSSKRDHGYYTCLAVNGKGFQYRGAYLTVLTHTPGEHSTSDVPTSSLPLLFLIPAALILVPVIAWVCCRWKQHHRRNCPPPHCRHDAVINTRREHHNNNPVHKQQRGAHSGFKYTSVSINGTRKCGSSERERTSSHLQQQIKLDCVTKVSDYAAIGLAVFGHSVLSQYVSGDGQEIRTASDMTTSNSAKI
ncbi:hypothetical protein Cfor_06530 [Coptotermes formosanus]|uniref:receptor protein-tyrosine kinase n=1 Tax=Coptotermes formosanus TaxID=36987 RepID=A0A6L2PIB8_COPFO|nr:hypothetical protein Cfor_06530 [Coptotermes formosanus]